MPQLKVPDRFQGAIAKLGELSEESFKELSEALRKAPACQNSAELSKWISTDTASFSDRDRRGMIDALASMFRVQRNSGQPKATFAQDVWNALQRDSRERVRNISAETLKSRVASLLEVPVLDLPNIKAGDLKSEVDRSFCSVRILTDLRPAFGDDPEEDPSAMVLLHTLQLGFHDDRGRHRGFYLSLDAEDISKMKAVLDRAEKKEKTLRRVLAEKGVKLFN